MTLSREQARTGTIRTWVPVEAGQMAPCVWCGEPTDIRAETPFRSDLGAIPLMLTCSADVLAAWRAHQAGTPMRKRWVENMVRLMSLT